MLLLLLYTVGGMDLLSGCSLSTDFWFSDYNVFKVALAKSLLTQLKTSKIS